MPSVLIAQAAPTPIETAVTPLVRVDTGTGTALLVVELSPSWPELLSPQHWTAPLTTAQAEAAFPFGLVCTDTAVTPAEVP